MFYYNCFFALPPQLSHLVVISELKLYYIESGIIRKYLKFVYLDVTFTVIYVFI